MFWIFNPLSVFDSVGDGCRHFQSQDMVTWICEVHSLVERSDVPNYKGVRAAVTSGLNFYNWRTYLKHYDIPVLCGYLHFGFPLNVNYQTFSFNS